MQELQAKYDELQRNWRNWESEDVAEWILSLDEQYQVFEDALRENVKNQEVDGADLEGLDKTDLHLLGINSRKHKMAILGQIRRLTAGQSHAAAVQSGYNEGTGNNATAYL